MSEEKKIYYPGMFDFIKGIAMIDIIAGHAVSVIHVADPALLYSNWLFILLMPLLNILGDSTIPLLFIIMGYGFRPMEEKRCLKKQTKQLLVPYLWTGLFVACVLPFCRFYYHRSLFDCILETARVAISHMLGLSQAASYFGHRFYFVGAAWFLVAAFVSWLLLNFLANHFQGKKLLFAVCICMLTGCCIGTKLVLPFSMEQSLVCVFYLYLGWQFQQRGSFSKKLSWWQWGLIVLFALVNLLFGKVSLSFGLWKLGLLDLLSVACQAFLIIWVALHINFYNFRIMAPIRTIGRYSMWIMCCHTVETQGLASFWYRFGEDWNASLTLELLTTILIKGLLIFTGCFLIQKYKKKCAQKKRMKRKTRGGRNVRS